MAVLTTSPWVVSLAPSAERLPTASGLPGESLEPPAQPGRMSIKLAAARATISRVREVRICFLMAKPFNEEQRSISKGRLALLRESPSVTRLAFHNKARKSGREPCTAELFLGCYAIPRSLHGLNGG